MKKVYKERLFRIITGAIAVMVVTAGLTSCGPAAEETEKTIVAVTILPQAGFVEAIGGDKVEVVVMVPPGASPHTYEVTPTQMAQLSKAKVYAKVGSPVEFELTWMDKLIAVNGAMLVVDCSEGIELIESGEEHHHEGEAEAEEHEHEGVDPHIWLSPKNAMIMARHICDGLKQVDPANEAFYEENYTAYTEELTELDSELAAELSGLANRKFIVVHPSFGYFAREYDLEQIGIEQSGKEAEADYLVRLITEAKEYDIRVVFVSPQFSRQSADSIAREIGGEVVIIDPLGKDVPENLRNIKEAVKQALENNG